MHTEVELNWDKVFIRNDSVVTREIVGETFLVPIKGELASMDKLFVLNPLATYIWVQFNGARDATTILQGIMNRFDIDVDTARNDCSQFIKDLMDAKLISEVPQ